VVTAQSPEGFAIPRPVTDLISSQPPPVRWFVSGMMREGLGVLAGRPNVGKTPFIIQAALSICSGSRFLGKVAVPKASKVLFWGAEYTPQELFPVMHESAAAMGL
jgi:RecA-family ATPase